MQHFLNLGQDGTRHLRLLVVGTAFGGFAFALLVLAFPSAGSRPIGQMARCSMGFLVSVMWIMAIADEVVNVLQVIYFGACLIGSTLTRSLF